MPPFLELFGRLHPLLVHLPIGLLVGALVLELAAARHPSVRAVLRPYLWIAALAAVVSASAGWVLAHEEGYDGPTLERHEQLGIAVAVAAVLAALLHDVRWEAPGRGGTRRVLYRVALGAACALLVPVGHLGSTMTRGADWLAGPRREPVTAAVTPADTTPAEATPADADAALAGPAGDASEPDPYTARIAPIFAARCTTCHGPKKHKGDLRLDSPEGMLAGGESGPALVPGDPAASRFLQRARLPLEHEDHMPPEGKPQPTAEELDALEAWVAAGAPHGAAGAVPSPAPSDAGAGEGEPGEEEVRASAPELEAASAPGETADLGPAPPAAALAALTRALVHHEPRAPGARELAIDVAAVAPGFGDAEVRALLVPLAPWIGALTLARSAITDAALAEVARFPLLERLDLRSTGVSDAGLAALAGHAALAELVLARTRLTDASVEVLAGLPSLRTVALWSSGISAEGLARLRAARPEVVVDAGDGSPAEALESEAELAFTSDRPLPGAEDVPEALRPVNATCPVSGSPVNPKYSVLHGARVVGFCCPNCPKDFWADPAKFEGKLP